MSFFWTGFAVTAFLAIILNLILVEEIEDEADEITANLADEADDQEEWSKIRGKKVIDSNTATVSEDVEMGEKGAAGEMKV